MKGVVVLGIFIFLFLTSTISASYVCPNDSVKEDLRELNIGKSKNINGLYVGLFKADEISALNRWSAELFIDAQSIILEDNTSVIYNFSDGSGYAVSMLNSSESNAVIKVESSSKIINGGEADTIGSLEVFVASVSGNYPGTASVNVLLGKKRLSLSNSNGYNEIITYDKKKYAIELYSASDDNAIVKVFRCNNESIGITEIVGVVNETKSVNETDNRTPNNQTGQNSTDNETGVNATDTTPDSNEGQTGESILDKPNRTRTFLIFGGIIFIIIIFLVILNKFSRRENPPVQQI
jgi:hypothetical protein